MARSFEAPVSSGAFIAVVADLPIVQGDDSALPRVQEAMGLLAGGKVRILKDAIPIFCALEEGRGVFFYIFRFIGVGRFFCIRGFLCV